MDTKRCTEKYVYRICIIILTSAIAKFSFKAFRYFACRYLYTTDVVDLSGIGEWTIPASPPFAMRNDDEKMALNLADRTVKLLIVQFHIFFLDE